MQLKVSFLDEEKGILYYRNNYRTEYLFSIEKNIKIGEMRVIDNRIYYVWHVDRSSRFPFTRKEKVHWRLLEESITFLTFDKKDKPE